MDDRWLEISDEDANGEELMRRIRKRLECREGPPHSAGAEDPRSVADALWSELVEEARDPAGEISISMQLRDCDIVPSGYEIDWRVPIVGWVHAIVRRIVNDEIRRYLIPSLEKQSAFNREVLQALIDLGQENAGLRREIETLRGARPE